MSSSSQPPAQPCFKIALCHAAYPFVGSATNTLTSTGLLRAITLLTGRDKLILTEAAWDRNVGKGQTKRVVHCIGRTDRDVRRLLFRSLAVPQSQFTRKGDEEKTEQVEMSQLSKDDILDALTVISRVQPHLMEKWRPLPADRFREMAVRLSTAQTPLKKLWIPYSDFLSLVRLLSTWCYNKDGSPYGPQLLYGTGTRTIERYLLEGEDVTFETFEKVSEDMLRSSGRLKGEAPRLKDLGRDSALERGTRDVILERDLFGCLSQIFESFVGVNTVPPYYS